MFEQTRKYDGSFSPRSSRAMNRPLSKPFWNGKEVIRTERPWNQPHRIKDSRPWTASHIARTDFLQSREAAKAENRSHDLRLKHGKMGLSSLSPRRGGYMVQSTISPR